MVSLASPRIGEASNPGLAQDPEHEVSQPEVVFLLQSASSLPKRVADLNSFTFDSDFCFVQEVGLTTVNGAVTCQRFREIKWPGLISGPVSSPSLRSTPSGGRS